MMNPNAVVTSATKHAQNNLMSGFCAASVADCCASDRGVVVEFMKRLFYYFGYSVSLL
jgi:hypothetical protein